MTQNVPPSVFSGSLGLLGVICRIGLALLAWVLPPPQPVSSIEPASTMLSMAIESFFIIISLLPKGPGHWPVFKHVYYYTSL